METNCIFPDSYISIVYQLKIIFINEIWFKLFAINYFEKQIIPILRDNAG
jgi:hypothetical protein